MSDTISKYPRLQRPLEIIVTATIYFFLARLCLLLQFENSNAAPLWIPSGFAFAMILLLGKRIVPGILIGAFSANAVVFISHSIELPTAIVVSLIISLGNAGEAIVGYYLLNKSPGVTGNNYLVKVTDTARFLFVAFLMCLVSSFVGATAVFFAGISSADNFLMVWLTWWLGDFSGILLTTPLILLWIDALRTRSYKFNENWNRTLENTALFLLVLVWSGIIFGNWFSLPPVFRWAYWIIPVLVLAAVRFNQIATITALILCSAIAILGTINGYGPFSSLQFSESLLTVQAFISIMAITILVLHATVNERKITEAKLRHTGNLLEIRVKERTIELEKKNRELENLTSVLEQKNNDLERLNKELESFAFVASHDLQEPLRKIQIFSNLMLETEIENLSITGKDYFNRIEIASGRMQQLILDLLTYSRTNAIKKHFEKTDLNQLLQQVKTELKEKITETNTTIENTGLPELSVIPFQFRQLFTNLINNSIKFSKPGFPTNILIKSSITNGTGIKNINDTQAKKYNHISFADNGIGFPQTYNEQIFGLFQRLHTSREYEGTGIGLSICKKIVENHQGIITAESEPDKGATFHIYLPIA